MYTLYSLVEGQIKSSKEVHSCTIAFHMQLQIEGFNFLETNSRVDQLYIDFRHHRNGKTKP